MPFFRYPGGKSKLSTPILAIIQSIMQQNPQIQSYAEPFFGGGGIGLEVLERISGIKTVHVNDKCVPLASLWTAVMHFPDELIANINIFQPNEPDFYLFKDWLLKTGEWSNAPEDILLRGFRQLAASQMSFSGLGVMACGPMGGRNPAPDNHHVADRWSPRYMSKRIRAYNALFGGVHLIGGRCTNSDFEDVIGGNDPTLIYLDPPYFEKGTQLYQHAFKLEDHQRLARTLQATQNPFVLSYDLQPEIVKLYSGWAMLYCLNARYTIHGSTQKSELIIVPESCRSHVCELVRSGWLTPLE